MSEIGTHAIRTLFGRLVFGSLTLTNANWILPSEKSSMRSWSSPSKLELSSPRGSDLIV